jgi:hypothetical protein
MSDFLTRLVQRQFGQIASVEPRIPDLYAPAAAMPLPITEEIAAQRSHSPSMILAAAAGEDAQPPETHARVLVELRQPELSHPNRIRRELVSQPGAEPVAMVSTERVAAEGAPLVSRSSAASPQGESSRALPVRADLPVREKGQEPRVASGMIATPAAPILVRRQTETCLNGPEATTRLAAPPRLEVKTSAGGESGVRARTPVDVEPPVHVTIGRIEVTARTAAPAPRRVSAPRKPAMSLDDYLARRQRGER